jgi:hypothetical protein
MEKQDKIIYAILGLGIAYFAYEFIVRKANSNSNTVAERPKDNYMTNKAMNKIGGVVIYT